MPGPKIELLAQKEREDASEVKMHTLQKLQDLVDKDVERSKRTEHIIDRGDNLSPLYDAEGFKIPVGKVPLDGQFTVAEVEELVHLGQEEGDLKDDIEVHVENKTPHFSQLIIEENEDGEDDENRK